MHSEGLPCPRLDLAPLLPKKARPDSHARVLFSNQVAHLEDHQLSSERCALVHVPFWGGRLGVYSKTMVNSCVALPIGFSAGLRMDDASPVVSRSEFLGAVIRHIRTLNALKGSFGGASAEAFRLVHGDADGLPGIVVDSYINASKNLCLVVVQSSSPVGDFLLPIVIAALKDLYPGSVLFERSTGQGRRLLGLEDRIQPLVGTVPEIMETKFCGLNLRFKPHSCQKTGLFLDQRANILQLGNLIGGEDFWTLARDPLGVRRSATRVLDLCSYAGAWSAKVAKNSACENVSVTLVDQDAVALELAAANVRQNAAHSSVHVETRCADVFAFLSDAAKNLRDPAQQEKYQFDIVIADPPAFAKSRKHVPEARRAYSRLNRLAMSLVAPGGLFVTCSCSRNIEAAEFRALVEDQLLEDNRLKQMEWIHLGTGTQARDHTIPVGRGVSDYLKCQYYQLRSLTQDQRFSNDF